MTEQRALALPDETQFRHDIQAINRFQAIVHQNLVVNQDYGVIPGTTKPTLLKPGAEKIAKLLGLADQYEIVDRQEDWAKPFFRYLIKCKLIHVASQSLISEGLGECNSMESKYRWRWISERDLPTGIDKTKLVTQERSAKTGGHWTVFRFENDDIYSQVNTILKMAKKRALVDAALSAGRLSNVFTQDIEDLPTPAEEMSGEAPDERPTNLEHWCQEHQTKFFKRGKMPGYAHKIEGTEKWCNEEKPIFTVEQVAREMAEATSSMPSKSPPEASQEQTGSGQVAVLAEQVKENLLGEPRQALPQFKNVPALWSYAMREGWDVKEIRNLFGVQNPADFKGSVEEAVKILYPSAGSGQVPTEKGGNK